MSVELDCGVVYSWTNVHNTQDFMGATQIYPFPNSE